MCLPVIFLLCIVQSRLVFYDVNLSAANAASCIQIVSAVKSQPTVSHPDVFSSELTESEFLNFSFVQFVATIFALLCDFHYQVNGS